MKKLLCLLIVFGLIIPTAFSTQWQEGTGQNTILGTISPSDIDKDSYENIVDPIDRMLTNLQEGCRITYASASTITVAAGEIMLSNSEASIKLMQQNTSSTTVTWSDIDTGAEASSTTYYLWAFQETATDTDFDVTISTSSSAPTGKTYYARLGSFYNDSSSNIEQVKNDVIKPEILVSTGTIAHGATISLPSGYTQEECEWTVSLGTHSSLYGQSNPDGIEYSVTVNSSRVVSARLRSINSGTYTNVTANYIIIGVKR